MKATAKKRLFNCKYPEKIETNIIGNILKREIFVKKLAKCKVSLSKPYEKILTKKVEEKKPIVNTKRQIKSIILVKLVVNFLALVSFEISLIWL